MTIAALTAKHLNDVFFGGNWTSVNVKDTLQDITWQEATTKVQSFNTIAVLVNHITYYITAVTKVLQGEKLNAKDSLSFTHPPINNATDWQSIQEAVWQSVHTFTQLISTLPDTQLTATFEQEKYGNYFRNLIGIIEHTHYHLGQIVILKKMIR